MLIHFFIKIFNNLTIFIFIKFTYFLNEYFTDLKHIYLSRKDVSIIEIDRIVEYVNTNARNYLTLLDDFEEVTDEINTRLEYKIVLHLKKPYINCSIKQLGISKSAAYSDIKKIMEQRNCDQKKAVLYYIEDMILNSQNS